MRISELLQEAQVIPREDREISGEEAKQLLETSCSEAFNTWGKLPLFRGSRNLTPGIYYIDPSKGTRKSQNIGNQYTMLMDNSPYFEEFPKRSHSLICSTDLSYAHNYGKGTGFYVYPKNGTKIGICPYRDIWFTKLPNNKYDLYDWESIAVQMHSLGFKDRFSFEEIIAYSKSKEFFDEAKFRSISDPEMFIQNIIEWMNPEKTGFKLITTNMQLPTVPRECWFSGPCVAIHERYIKPFIEDIYT